MKLPGTVYAGEGSLSKLPQIAQNYHRAALFTDQGIRSAGITQKPEELLRQAGLEVTVLDQLPAEPSYLQAQAIVEEFKQTDSDLIVAVGGGSVMDIAKLASVAATNDYCIRDMLSDPLIGKKQIPTLLIPTTAGTGSEATPNSIVAVPEQELKVGIVNPAMMADYVILDGEMIRTLPKKIAAATGLDALAHAIECYTSNKANPFSNLFAMEALKLIFSNLEEACLNPDAVQAKNNMLLAAFYGGASITASGTTAVHALSYPLGGKYHIAHGISNAIMLLPVMRFNKDACLKEFAAVYDALHKTELPDHTEKESPPKEASVKPTDSQKADWVLGRMESLIQNLEIPSSLREFGVDQKDLDALVEGGMNVQRLLVNNKRTVTAEDARMLYLEVL